MIIDGGIKVEEEVSGKGGGGVGGGLGKKFFGGSEVVGWHHLGEYANRWLGPVVPRKLECEFKYVFSSLSSEGGSLISSSSRE